jgi:hypothetical protein
MGGWRVTGGANVALALAAAFTLCVAPLDARAGEGHESGHGHGDQDQDLVLEGHVTPHCALSGEGLSGAGGTIHRTIDLSNPHALADVQLNLHVACTQHFVIGLIPQYARMQNLSVVNGALQPAVVGDGYSAPGGAMAQGFVGALKYRLSAVLNAAQLPSNASALSYQSPGDGPGAGIFSTPLPPMSGALSVTIDPVELPAAVGLLAGSYEENITIQLTPQGY